MLKQTGQCYLLPAVILMVASACPGLYASANDDVSLRVGDAVPGWKDLPGTDGNQHSMQDLKDSSVIIVCFTCNTCPYSVDYEDRLIALQQKYVDAALPVKLVAINANAVAADELPEMKKRAEQKNFNFAYLRDDQQATARAWGALYTPEFFVLNRDRLIVYTGALDDSTDASKVQQRYVEAAVEAALAGKRPEVTTTAARGCLVRYPRQRRQSESK